MSNDQSLPRPNLPQPPAPVGTQPQATSTPQAAPTTSITQPNTAPTAPAVVSGLDSQHPGGPPPKLNDQGQVVNTSVISKTQQAPTFDQPQDLPQSTLQKMQITSANQVAQKPGSALGMAAQAPINPAANQQQQQQVSVGSQQKIGFQTDTPQDIEADIRQTGTGVKKTHPSLGINLPGKPGSPSTGQNISEKKQDNKSKPAKQTKATKATGPIVAKAKSPLLKYVLFGLVGLLVVGGVIFGIMQVLGGGSGKTSPTQTAQGPNDSTNSSEGSTSTSQPAKSNVVLSYWGLWEPEPIMAEVLKEFEEKTGISVDYRQQSHKDYRTRLQSAVTEGNGPDVFRYHATWVPMLKNELAVLPSSIMSTTEYEKTFYPIHVQQLQLNGQLVGIPLMYDGLGLYYNKDILQTANEEVPGTWGELRVLAEKLTVRKGNEVERGGVALGNTTNVEHFADILGLLIYQNGGDPAAPISGEVRDAIDFYALFAQGKAVFSENLPSSTVAFARGDVAMMLAPSWRVHEILNLNPDLNFEIAPVPKLGNSEFGWANYWAEGVSKKSANQDEAWQLLAYLSSKEVLRKLYSAQSENRAFGEIYPRVDMAEELANAKYVSAFLDDAKLAKSGPMCSFTHDSGLNDSVIDYYKDAVNIANKGSLSEKEIQTLGSGVTKVIDQYK